MTRSRNRGDPSAPSQDLARIARPLSLAAQVEQVLRQAIADGRWGAGRLPTEVELAEQLGVSRETVRLAAESLQHDGLLVKIRRRGTFTRAPRLALPVPIRASTLLGYMQAAYPAAQGQEEAVTRAVSGLMLQGANEEAGRAAVELVVLHAQNLHVQQAFYRTQQTSP